MVFTDEVNSLDGPSAGPLEYLFSVESELQDILTCLRFNLEVLVSIRRFYEKLSKLIGLQNGVSPSGTQTGATSNPSKFSAYLESDVMSLFFFHLEQLEQQLQTLISASEHVMEEVRAGMRLVRHCLPFRSVRDATLTNLRKDCGYGREKGKEVSGVGECELPQDPLYL